MNDLSKWFCGFFDSEGYLIVKVGKSNQHDIGYRMEVKVMINHSYVTGVLDGEGCLVAHVYEDGRSGVSYSIQPNAQVKMGDDRVLDALVKYSDSCGSSSSKREHSDGIFTWECAGVDNVRNILEPIRDGFIVKTEQVNIMLDKIIPMLEKGRHLDKMGFLKTMKYVDEMNSYKGGKRGKYNLEYFEEEWGMSLDEQKGIGEW